MFCVKFVYGSKFTHIFISRKEWWHSATPSCCLWIPLPIPARVFMEGSERHLTLMSETKKKFLHRQITKMVLVWCSFRSSTISLKNRSSSSRSIYYCYGCKCTYRFFNSCIYYCQCIAVGGIGISLACFYETLDRTICLLISIFFCLSLSWQYRFS